MKRRKANIWDGKYIQKKINNDYVKGYVCHIIFDDSTEKFTVNNSISDICIKDNGYEWFLIYPENDNYVLSIMFNNKKEIIEWYFDVSKEVGLEDGIPYEDDLYLDLVVEPNGEKIILDEDELFDALNKNDIIKEDVDFAYDVLNKLIKKYVDNFDYLKTFTNIICKEFNSKCRV